MIPAEERTPQQLIGQRVAFRGGEEHADCWHTRVGFLRGVVLRPGQTLAQKAEWISGEGGEVPSDWKDDYEDVPRVWIKADPVEGFPRGCEVAVETACLLILEAGEL